MAGVAVLNAPTAKDEAAPSPLPDTSDVAAYVRSVDELDFARGRDSIYSAARAVLDSMGLDIRRPGKLLKEYDALNGLQKGYKSLMRRYPNEAFDNGVPRNVLDSMSVIGQAAERYGLRGSLIAAVLVAESDGYQYAVAKAQGRDGTLTALAAGSAGINALVHYLGEDDPARVFEFRENVDQCGKILSRYIAEAHGNVRRALGRYSGNGYDSYGKRYARKVLRLAAKIERMSGADSLSREDYALR